MLSNDTADLQDPIFVETRKMFMAVGFLCQGGKTNLKNFRRQARQRYCHGRARSELPAFKMQVG